MKVSKQTVIRIIVFHIVVIYLAVVALLHTGCRVDKLFASKRNDSTSVAAKKLDKTDSVNTGAVSKSNALSREELEWWKTTLQFPKGDTVTNNIYPSTVIYEGGKGKKETETNRYDSTYSNALQKIISDSLSAISRKVEESTKEKHSETKGLGLMTVLLLMAGYVVVTKGLGWVISKYTIVKK